MERIDRLAGEPYRIFFPLAVAMGMIGISHWLLYALGFLSGYSGVFHASLQMQAYMSCFVFGFLMTAVPRMSGTPYASRGEVGRVLLLVLLLAGFQYAGKPVLAHLAFAGMLASLALFVRKRFKQKRESVDPPVEFVWLPFALAIGFLGSLSLSLGIAARLPPWVLRTGKALIDQGFLIAIVLGVGCFLGPRLMGTFRIEPVQLDPGAKREAERHRKVKRIAHVMLASILVLSFFLEGFSAERLAYGLRAAVVSIVLIWARALALRPKNPDAFVRLVWVSFWMVFLGSWSAFLFLSHRREMLHLVFLGGYSLMTFGVATMVVLSHAGAGEQLRGRNRLLQTVLAGVLAAAVLRAGSAFSPEHYFGWLGASSALWLAVALIWIAWTAPFLARFSGEEAVRLMHEEAKARLLGERKE